MISLILDCSCGMGVYLANDNKVYSNVDVSQNKHSDEILVVVDKLLNEAEINIRDLNNICVCVGPGSFTGVRVAISLVKGLAIGSGAKVYALSNFDIFDVNNKKTSYLILEGFSSFVYARKFDAGKFTDECIDLNQLQNELAQNSFDVYVTSEKTQNFLKKYEISSKIIKNNIINAFMDKIKNDRSVELNQIFPVYLRASQAEIEREKKIKNG